MTLLRPDRDAGQFQWIGAFGLSALVHLAALFALIEVYRGLGAAPGAAVEPPAIQVTSLVLDAVSIANLPQEGTRDETPDPETDGETPEAITPDLVEPLTPEPVPAVEPAPEPEPEPEEPPQEAETTEPETPEPIAPPTFTPEPVQPEIAAAATPLSPISPIKSDAGLAPVAVAPANGAQRIAPVGAIAALPERITATPSAAQAPTSIAPRATLPERASLPRPTPATPPVAGAPNDPSAGRALTELIARIRGHQGAPCLLALPQLRNGADPELVLMAAQEAAIQQFMSDVFAGASAIPDQRPLLIDGRQCAALEFLRAQTTYPAFRLSLSVAARDVASGGNLIGSVANAAGSYLSLLLVDDNGVVQDLGEFVGFSGGKASFDVPLTRNGAPRDTSQLLIAVATPTRPKALDAQAGQLAEDFFAALASDVQSDARFALIPFDVR